MSLITTTADRLMGLFGYVRAKPDEIVRWENRANLFTVNDLLYSGLVYNTRANGGALEDVLRSYVGNAYCDVNRYRIQPAFLPFKEIVDVYQNALPGTWGKGVRIAPEFDGKPINPKLEPALSRVWRASNLDTEKATLFRWAANFGTVGIRIWANGKSDTGDPRVAIGVDHPSRLFNFEEDAEGNVTAVCLKYKKQVNVGTLAEPDWETVDVVEEITKEDFSRTFDGTEQLDDAVRPNALGFCPYVVLRHKDNGTPFGDWAYKGSEPAVHRINWRIGRQDKSIDRHQFPKWFAAAGGKQPTTDVMMGDEALTYVQTSPDTPPPTLQAIVPQIDQDASQAFWQSLRDLLRGPQPELNLNDVKLLGNISGEALAQVLKPTASAVDAVKPAYHHAMTRALQMAVSAGVVVGAWDVGTGAGSSEAGDRAFREGKESFEFVPTPPLPQTVFDQIQQAKAETAVDSARVDLMARAENVTALSDMERLRLGGYDEKEAEKIRQERLKQDAIQPDDPNDPENNNDGGGD